MGNIVLLDELTINKIAAGEVIERPASVIKEMVENSIDAESTKITIEIKNGGISYIKITDNGKGIAQDDLEMAFERHATSKIRSSDDLNEVKTMGFRGEALASIAAIANVELVSKTLYQENGYKVVVEGGKILEKQEIGCQTGTTITVKNLFFNTPVRYKFLKKDYTETGYIEDVITRIALVNPQIAFKLINTGKTILQTPGTGELQTTIYSIYGKDISQGVIRVNYNFEDMKVSGVIGKPEISRSNRGNQLFFVNKRYVKDKILTAATEQGYKGTIPAGKFGFVVLNIEMPQSKVDVNVHPAKLEVRFEDESKVFQAIFHAIKDTMAKYIAENDQTTKVDNIIIQSSSKITSNSQNEAELTSQIEEQKTNGLFSWRKNKIGKNFNDEKNIIEDLYNKKNLNQYHNQDEEKYVPKAFASNENISPENNNLKTTDYNTSKTDTIDNIVDTSDVLKELKQINEENKKSEVNENEPKIEINANDMKGVQFSFEEKNLPDGKTYTYFGENKDKIENLLRQLHPETYKPKEVESLEDVSGNYDFKVNTSKMEEQEQQIDKQEQTIYVKEQEENVEIHADIIEDKDYEVIEQQEDDLNEKEQSQNKEEVVEATEKNTNPENTANFNEMYEKLFGTVIKDPNEEQQEEKISAVDIIQDNVSIFEEIANYSGPTYKFIGVVFNSYIIAEIQKEMYIINQNTAKEKIIYEKLRKNYYNQTEKDSQMLLLPDILELSRKQIEIVKENYSMLSKAGFCLEEFGENTIKLNGVPTVCMDLDTKKLFCEIIEAVNTVARTSIQEKEEKFIATIAEKIAQKASNVTTIQEIDSLMYELLNMPNPFNFTFDKPIAIKMTKYDIERKFSRK